MVIVAVPLLRNAPEWAPIFEVNEQFVILTVPEFDTAPAKPNGKATVLDVKSHFVIATAAVAEMSTAPPNMVALLF